MGNPYSKKNKRVYRTVGYAENREERTTKTKGKRAETNSFVMLMKLVIEKYNLLAAPTAINLAKLKQYDELKEQFLDFNTIRTCEDLMTCLMLHFEAVDTISFDQNGIKSPTVLLNVMKKMNMAGMYKALSFKDNIITDFTWISILKSFSALQELRCAGNPIANDTSYRKYISKALPGLILLDDKNTEKVSLSLPWPRNPGGELGPIREVCTTLITNYENVFRTNIHEITRFYHPDARLTVTTSNSFSVVLPNGALGSEIKEAVRLQQILSDLNHNLGKASPTSTKHNRIKKGSAELTESLSSIFKFTRLKVYMETDVDKHLSVSQPGLGSQTKLTKVDILVVKIHGNLMIEVPSLDRTITRCFDRIWTLAKSDTGEIVIYNDLIHFRQSEPSPLWCPTMGDRISKLGRKYALPDNVCNEILALASNDIQCSLLVEFVALTRLKPNTALNCLSLAENDLERAQKLYEEKKALLGAEHYLADSQQ
ncbi:TAP Cterminal subfamily protein [Perkinsela sp. CCAP 1560/4]|nr:TAP Cterminal subfamily protein [Perkinsela sp. CCAP 1560/4]|eukprot:KNH06354.1 TAP Cterminal subfamily protein [Perkinsela sp. CCAP 1560/4]